jgi:adenosylhomocysteine nucleosidase
VSRIGIVTALPFEARAWARRRLRTGELVETRPGLYLMVSGMGAANAERAGRELLNRGCEALVSWGTAGALRAGLHSGQLVVADRVIDEQALSHRLDPDWVRRATRRLEGAAQVLNAPVADTGRILDGPGAKQRLGSMTGAAIVDMESAALARLAEQHAVPLLVVRAVVDEVDVAVPRSVITATDEHGHVHVGRLLVRLTLSPGEWTTMNRLRHGFARARRRLQRAAGVLSPDLALSESSEG